MVFERLHRGGAKKGGCNGNADSTTHFSRFSFFTRYEKRCSLSSNSLKSDQVKKKSIVKQSTKKRGKSHTHPFLPSLPLFKNMTSTGSPRTKPRTIIAELVPQANRTRFLVYAHDQTQSHDPFLNRLFSLVKVPSTRAFIKDAVTKAGGGKYVVVGNTVSVNMEGVKRRLLSDGKNRRRRRRSRSRR